MKMKKLVISNSRESWQEEINEILQIVQPLTKTQKESIISEIEDLKQEQDIVITSTEDMNNIKER